MQKPRQSNIEHNMMLGGQLFCAMLYKPQGNVHYMESALVLDIYKLLSRGIINPKHMDLSNGM